MKLKRVLLCGATLLIACTLGSAVHASANSKNNNQNNVVTQIKQTNNNNQNSNNKQELTGQNSFSTSNNNINNTNNKHQTVPVHKYYQIHHEQRTDFYTRINKPLHHYQGHAIYANPYGTNANSYRPIGHQRQLANQVIHVIREATVNNRRWINFHSKINGWIRDNAVNKNLRWLKVPLISQRPQLPSGCEITATTMMLKYRDGHKINKMKLAREMPRSSNPNYGFVGSPYSASGWWIKPRALMHLVNHYTHRKALNMSYDSKQSIIRQINKGIPVVIWVGYMDGFPNHALTIYGYKKHAFMYNDPWLDRREVRSFRYLWAKHAEDPVAPYGALSYKK